MKWSVLEVKPEPHHRLFVRFQDGVAGYVSLRDDHFFAQAFIDDGAAAWPDEIDLAPDAMYAQIVS